MIAGDTIPRPRQTTCTKWKGNYDEISHSARSLFAATFNLLAASTQAGHWTEGMAEGKPDIKTISQVAFGPEGILFIADAKSAAIFAVATSDTKPGSASNGIRVEGINRKIAGLLGASAEQILIDDVTENPVSHNAYLAASRGRGPDAI